MNRPFANLASRNCRHLSTKISISLMLKLFQYKNFTNFVSQEQAIFSRSNIKYFLVLVNLVLLARQSRSKGIRDRCQITLLEIGFVITYTRSNCYKKSRSHCFSIFKVGDCAHKQMPNDFCRWYCCFFCQKNDGVDLRFFKRNNDQSRFAWNLGS